MGSNPGEKTKEEMKKFRQALGLKKYNPKKRTCLKCECEFDSDGPFQWLCKQCSRVR